MEEKETQNTPNSKENALDKRDAFFNSFKELLEKKERPEDQLSVAISFMKDAILNSKKPKFKHFWSAQKICASLFKEKIGLMQRKYLWSEYIELLKEARCLKGIKEEQANFSFAQIELAVEALELEIKNLDTQVKIPEKKKTFTSKSVFALKKNTYYQWSHELTILKSAAARLLSLRKEFLSLSLQTVKRKNLFNRLDNLGDAIFPRRKKLIEVAGASFIKDIEDFVTYRCIDQKNKVDCDSKASMPYHVVQKEIKNFQSFAKLLHLNRSAFHKARGLLSQAWDSSKEKEVENKNKLEELSDEQEKNFETFSKKVFDFKVFCQDPANLVKEKILQKKETLLKEGRALNLTKQAFSTLLAAINEIEDGAYAIIKEKMLQKRHIEEKKINKLKETLAKLLVETNSYSFVELDQKQEAFIDEYRACELNKIDQLTLEHQFVELNSSILDKKSENILLKEDIEELYGQWLDLQKEVKNKIEIYRKQIGSSVLDIEKALIYRELYDSAKLQLSKISSALQNLEEKFIKLES